MARARNKPLKKKPSKATKKKNLDAAKAYVKKAVKKVKSSPAVKAAKQRDIAKRNAEYKRVAEEKAKKKAARSSPKSNPTVTKSAKAAAKRSKARKDASKRAASSPYKDK